MTDPKKEPGIRIGQIYLESASFRHREDHLRFSPGTQPNAGPINLELEAGFSPDEQSALVRVKVSTAPSEEAMYSFDLTMVALVRVDKEMPNMPLQRYVSVAATTLLYPFVREAVANLTTRGRFGPVWLAPFNMQGAWEKTAQTPQDVEARPEARIGRSKVRRDRKRTKQSH